MALSFYIGGAPVTSRGGVAGYILSGSQRDIVGKKGTFDPFVTKATWENAQSAVLHQGNTTVYEFAIPIEGDISHGNVISADVTVIDVDQGAEMSSPTMAHWG